MVAAGCFVRLHSYGTSDISPTTDDWFIALDINDVVYVNDPYPAPRGVHTYLVNASDCTASDYQFFHPWDDASESPRFTNYLNSLPDGRSLILFPPFSRFVKRFALCSMTVVLSICLSVCNVGALWPNAWMDQVESWHGGRHRSRHIVLQGDPFPPKGHSPSQFSAHVCCGQTVGWIKMPFGTELSLGPSDIVLDGDPAPRKKGHSSPSPIFGSCLLWSNGWMDQNATGCEGRPQSLATVLDGDPAPPKGHRLPNFWPMSVMAKRLDGSRCHLVRRYTSVHATLC